MLGRLKELGKSTIGPVERGTLTVTNMLIGYVSRRNEAWNIWGL